MSFSRKSWMAIRQALLSIVNAIELELNLSPTTAEIRKSFKE